MISLTEEEETIEIVQRILPWCMTVRVKGAVIGVVMEVVMKELFRKTDETSTARRALTMAAVRNDQEPRTNVQRALNPQTPRDGG